MPQLTVFINKEVRKQVQALYQKGGQFQKAAEKVKGLLFDLTNKLEDPAKVMANVPKTNHGESRIKHCVKYDLSGFCRLVTIQDNGWLVLLYLGSHDEVDRWLEQNRGLQIAVKDADAGLFEMYKSEDINDADARINPQSDFADGLLYTKLKHYYSRISNSLPALIRKTLERFDTASEEEEIWEAAMAVTDTDQQEMIFDTFMLLRGGKVDEAKNRILEYEDRLTLLQNLSEEAIKDLRSNDQFLKINDLDSEDLHLLMSHKDWLEWMLFMHPAQKEVVDKDFNGSARLLGVSGSGKTCVVVRRAVRLAKKYPDEKVLILTLNPALAQLISNLVSKLVANYECPEVKDRIEIKSFWELCKDLIIRLRNHPFDRRILGPVTDKHNETIDEVWEEYYQCANNNNDAEVLFPTHCSLLARGIWPQEYLRQELDWIRSFLPKNRRNEYLNVEREGRTIPLQEVDREKILDGLITWERKMRDVGAIDYLGLANELELLSENLQPEYRCILVDEVQDFGTLELSIIRKLVAEGENDLFLTGDIAQQVYTKHHKIRNAGINILPDAYLKILKNYRNSREILSAAYEVFRLNTTEEQFKSDDFEVLNPEFANFSSPKPFLRSSETFSQELMSAITYLNEILGEKEKACISLCGYTLFEVQEIGSLVRLPVLDSEASVGDEKIYLSDLEQTKGFEFDRMVIINVNQDVIPNSMLPQDEWYRDISKLYVAMTRAKKELVVSYSTKLSFLFDGCGDYFNRDTWLDHVAVNDLVILELPSKRYKTTVFDPGKVTGKEFVFSKNAIGITRELQNKLIEHVAGKPITLNGKKVGWANMDELKKDILSHHNVPHYTKLFGPVVYKELQSLVGQKRAEVKPLLS